AKALEAGDYKPQPPGPVRLKRSVVARAAEIPAAALYLAVDAQFGAHVLNAAGAGINATLRCHPQFDVLIIDFGAEVEAAIAQLFLDIGYGQGRLAGAV